MKKTKLLSLTLLALLLGSISAMADECNTKLPLEIDLDYFGSPYPETGTKLNQQPCFSSASDDWVFDMTLYAFGSTADNAMLTLPAITLTGNVPYVVNPFFLSNVNGPLKIYASNDPSTPKAQLIFSDTPTYEDAGGGYIYASPTCSIPTSFNNTGEVYITIEKASDGIWFTNTGIMIYAQQIDPATIQIKDTIEDGGWEGKVVTFENQTIDCPEVRFKPNNGDEEIDSYNVDQSSDKPCQRYWLGLDWPSDKGLSGSLIILSSYETRQYYPDFPDTLAVLETILTNPCAQANIPTVDPATIQIKDSFDNGGYYEGKVVTFDKCPYYPYDLQVEFLPNGVDYATGGSQDDNRFLIGMIGRRGDVIPGSLRIIGNMYEGYDTLAVLDTILTNPCYFGNHEDFDHYQSYYANFETYAINGDGSGYVSFMPGTETPSDSSSLANQPCWSGDKDTWYVSTKYADADNDNYQCLVGTVAGDKLVMPKLYSHAYSSIYERGDDETLKFDLYMNEGSSITDGVKIYASRTETPTDADLLGFICVNKQTDADQFMTYTIRLPEWAFCKDEYSIDDGYNPIYISFEKVGTKDIYLDNVIFESTSMSYYSDVKLPTVSVSSITANSAQLSISTTTNLARYMLTTSPIEDVNDNYYQPYYHPERSIPYTKPITLSDLEKETIYYLYACTDSVDEYTNHYYSLWTSIPTIFKTLGDEPQVTDIDLEDTEAVPSAYVNNTYNVTMKGRTLRAGMYNTLTLPFSLTADQKAASDIAAATIYAYDGTEKSGNAMDVVLEEATAMTAGVPYIVDVPAGANIVNPKFPNVTITTTSGSTVEDTNLDLIGVLAPTLMPVGKTNLMVGENNSLFWSNTEANLNAFRSYFKVNNDQQAGAPCRFTVGRGGMTDLKNTKTNVDVQKFIRNNQLYFRKDGKLFNAQGQMVK